MTAWVASDSQTPASWMSPATGYGRDRDRLDPSLRMLARVSAEKGEPGSQRHRANAETDNAVCDIGRKLVSSAALNRRRTDGARHVQLQG